MTDKTFLKLIDFTVYGKCYIPTNKDAEEFLYTNAEDMGLQEHEFCLIPLGENAINLVENSEPGKVLNFEECSARDLTFHRGYMKFITSIYDRLPGKFQKQVDKKYFYLFLKHLQKNYEVVFRFRDEEKKHEIITELKKFKKEFRLTYKVIDRIGEMFGKSELIEYTSIAFGRMSEVAFHEYVRNQLPFIYSNVVGALFSGEEYEIVVEGIEKDFKKFIQKI